MLDKDMIDAGRQLVDELQAAIRRMGLESGLTVFQCIGALEVVKANLLAKLNAAQGKDDETDETPA